MHKLLSIVVLLLLATFPTQAQLLKTKSGNALISDTSGSFRLKAYVPSAQKYMVFNTRQRLAASPASILSNVSEVTRISFNTPTWAVRNPMFYFACWYGDDTGAYPIEKFPSGNCTIDGANVESSPNTIFTNITFNGSTTVTIPAGSGVWSDAVAGLTLAANSVFFTRQSVTVGAGQTMFGNYNSQSTLGEGAYFNASPTLSLLTSTWSVTSTSTIYGPSFYAGQGWDGVTPVIATTGDSIGYGANENEHHTGNSRGVWGYLMRGLDDAASSTRYAAETLNIPGADCGDDANVALGYYGRRIGMLNGLPNVPFTTILDEHGTNDATIGDLETWWTFIRANLKANYIVKTTIPPHTTSASNTLFDSYASQTPDSAAYTYPSGNIWVVNAGIIAGTYSAWINKYIDINPYASGINNVPTSHPDLWFVPSFTTTLAASATAGSTTLSLNAAPNISDCLVIDSGTSSVDADSTIGLVVSAVSGSGPYTVTLGNGGALGQNHSIGASVTEQYSRDGLHPGQCGHIGIAPAVIAAKNANVFK